MSDMQTTGWPPGLLQDDSRELSRWLSTRLGARYQIQRNNMQTNQTPESLAEEILCLNANGMDLTEELKRLRDMAASGAKDAERLREALTALLSLVQREAPHLSGKVMGNAEAAIAAKKRGAA